MSRQGHPGRPSSRSIVSQRTHASTEASRARALATRYTQARVRSSHDVLTYLQRHDVPRSLGARTVAACQAHGLIDDHACARLWAEHWARSGWAWVVIREKLLAKGLPAQAIEAAAERVGDKMAESLRARQLIEQRGLAGPHQRRRMARTLAARGFETELIEQLVDLSEQ